MEIKRIDPHLVQWSVDGSVAIACETGGIQLLVPDSVELLQGDIQWRRMRSPELAGRVLDMKWSPTDCSAYFDCVLVSVLDTGDAVILENSSGQTEPWSSRLVGGNWSSCAWSGNNLLLGGSDAQIQAFNLDLQPLWAAAVPVPKRIVQLSCNETHLGAVLEDNSVWILDFSTKQWNNIVKASRFHIFATQFTSSQLVVARIDGVFTFRGDKKSYSKLSHYVPGHLLVYQDEWAIVHTDGQVSQASPASSRIIRLPEIKGHVFGAIAHPYLPIGLLLLGPVTADWEYPIVSWQWAKTAFFVLPGNAELPQITKFASQMYWMMLLVSEKQPSRQNIFEKYTSPSSELTLQRALEILFKSKWFDSKRLEWYLSPPDNRRDIVTAMRSEIARLVCAEPQKTELDKAIVRWYSSYLEPGQALKVEEDDLLVLTLETDFVKESFVVDPNQNDTISSQEGHLWKRCSLTLVPLLSLNTRISLDHEFSTYKTVPGDSPIAEALLGAGRFCIYSGTQWERPRF